MDLESLNAHIENVPNLVELIGSTDSEQIEQLSSGLLAISDILQEVKAYSDNAEKCIEEQMNRISALQKLNKELAMEKYAKDDTIKQAKEVLSVSDELAKLTEF